MSYLSPSRNFHRVFILVVIHAITNHLGLSQTFDCKVRMYEIEMPDDGKESSNIMEKLSSNLQKISEEPNIDVNFDYPRKEYSSRFLLDVIAKLGEQSFPKNIVLISAAQENSSNEKSCELLISQELSKYGQLCEMDISFLEKDINENILIFSLIDGNHIPFCIKLNSQLLQTRSLTEDSEPANVDSLDSKNIHLNVQKLQLQQQGLETGAIVVIVIVLVLVVLAVFAAIKYIKRKREKGPDKKQSKLEKQKFIPRLQISSQAPFNQDKNILQGDILQKKNSNKNSKSSGLPKLLSPNQKPHTLKLEENHQSSVINDNIFTNLDSPHSLEEESGTPSVKNTPKEINFNIEFSILEQDSSKIKTVRDNE